MRLTGCSTSSPTSSCFWRMNKWTITWGAGVTVFIITSLDPSSGLSSRGCFSCWKAGRTFSRLRPCSGIWRYGNCKVGRSRYPEGISWQLIGECVNGPFHPSENGFDVTGEGQQRHRTLLLVSTPRVTPCVPPWDRCPSRGHGVPLCPTAPPCVLWRISSFEWNLDSSASIFSGKICYAAQRTVTRRIFTVTRRNAAYTHGPFRNAP